MAIIKTLKENELITGTNDTPVYPVTSTQAIYSQNASGQTPSGVSPKLEDRLVDIEDDADSLHRQTEKLTVALTNDKGGTTLEINGSSYVMHLSGSAKVDTFGDAESVIVNPSAMTSKQLSVTPSSSGTAIDVDGTADGNYWKGSYEIPSNTGVGSYTSRFTCTYNGVTRYTTTTTNVNLRKFVGFASSQPSDITTLGNASDPNLFSNSVSCTAIVPSNYDDPVDETKFKKIYIAVPSGMTVHTVIQPDSLNAPLEIENINNPTTVNRIIDGTTYSYKLYWSADYIDSSINKKLTIS